MDRRALFKSVFTAGPGFLAAVFRSNAEAAASTSDTVPRVAYHLSDLDKAAFVLGNIRNHFDGVGGPGNVRIALVVHGPALRAFRLDDGNEAITKAFEALRDNGVAYHVGGTSWVVRRRRRDLNVIVVSTGIKQPHFHRFCRWTAPRRRCGTDAIKVSKFFA